MAERERLGTLLKARTVGLLGTINIKEESNGMFLIEVIGCQLCWPDGDNTPCTAWDISPNDAYVGLFDRLVNLPHGAYVLDGQGRKQRLVQGVWQTIED